MKTSWMYPSLADKTAGIERRFIVMKIIDDGHNHFQR
jgi:hypothetical protein